MISEKMRNNRTELMNRYGLPYEYIDRFGICLFKCDDGDYLIEIFRPTHIKIKDPDVTDIQRSGPEIVGYTISNGFVDVNLWGDDCDVCSMTVDIPQIDKITTNQYTSFSGEYV